MKLRPGVDRREAEYRMGGILAKTMPCLRAEDLDDPPPPNSLLSLLFRPRPVRNDEET